MSYALGAANFPAGIAEFVNPGLAPRENHVRYPVLHPRNDTSSSKPNSTFDGPTVNMFIDALDDDYGYAASIINACVGTTVYALQCTKGPAAESASLAALGAGQFACGPDSPDLGTLTAGPAVYALTTVVQTNTMGVAVSISAAESCALGGTTDATCTATVALSADKTSTTTSLVETITGTRYRRFDVAITGGAEKTANPTACPTPNAAGSLNPKNMALWAFAGAMGVASMLAM